MRKDFRGGIRMAPPFATTDENQNIKLRLTLNSTGATT